MRINSLSLAALTAIALACAALPAKADGLFFGFHAGPPSPPLGFYVGPPPPPPGFYGGAPEDGDWRWRHHRRWREDRHEVEDFGPRQVCHTELRVQDVYDHGRYQGQRRVPVQACHWMN